MSTSESSLRKEKPIKLGNFLINVKSVTKREGYETKDTTHPNSRDAQVPEIVSRSFLTWDIEGVFIGGKQQFSSGQADFGGSHVDEYLDFRDWNINNTKTKTHEYYDEALGLCKVSVISIETTHSVDKRGLIPVRLQLVGVPISELKAENFIREDATATVVFKMTRLFFNYSSQLNADVLSSFIDILQEINDYYQIVRAQISTPLLERLTSIEIGLLTKLSPLLGIFNTGKEIVSDIQEFVDGFKEAFLSFIQEPDTDTEDGKAVVTYKPIVALSDIIDSIIAPDDYTIEEDSYNIQTMGKRNFDNYIKVFIGLCKTVAVLSLMNELEFADIDYEDYIIGNHGFGQLTTDSIKTLYNKIDDKIFSFITYYRAKDNLNIFYAGKRINSLQLMTSGGDFISIIEDIKLTLNGIFIKNIAEFPTVLKKNTNGNNFCSGYFLETRESFNNNIGTGLSGRFINDSFIEQPYHLVVN